MRIAYILFFIMLSMKAIAQVEVDTSSFESSFNSVSSDQMKKLKVSNTLLEKSDSISKKLDSSIVKSNFFDFKPLLDTEWSSLKSLDETKSPLNNYLPNNYKDFKAINYEAVEDKLLKNFKNDSLFAKIYSKKVWISKYDSLKNILNYDNDNLPFKEFDESKINNIKSEDYIKLLDFEDLSTNRDIAIDSVNNQTDQALVDNEILAQENQSISRYDSIRNVRIIDNSELSVVHSKKVDKEVKLLLDSVKDKHIDDLDFKLLEKLDSSNNKVVTLKEKKSFFDKTYFEGIIGTSKSDLSQFQLSPALGYEFINNMSVGMGPELSIDNKKDSIKGTAFGMRSFVKKDLFNKMAYFQLEYAITDFPELFKEGTKKMDGSTNNLLVGGGLLIPLYGKFKLNCAAYFDASQINNKESDTMMVFRIGISTLK